VIPIAKVNSTPIGAVRSDGVGRAVRAMATGFVANQVDTPKWTRHIAAPFLSPPSGDLSCLRNWSQRHAAYLRPIADLQSARSALIQANWESSYDPQ
jgi:hypothetical protein